MIRVHRLDGKEFVVNADLIETVEATPDTVISLTTGRKFVVKEGVDEIVALVVEFNRRRMAGADLMPAGRLPAGKGGSAGAAGKLERPAAWT